MRTVFRLLVVSLVVMAPLGSVASQSRTGGNNGVPIVFVHGFAGSTLVDSNGAVKWLDAWESVGWKTPSLALPMTWLNGIQGRDELRPGVALRDVHVLFGLFGTNVYGPWLDAIGRLKRPVYQFIYDWRRDPLVVNEEFKAFLAHASVEHAGAKLDVVGHSLGALYVMAALNDRPELFNQAIMVGAPFSGDINALVDIQDGIPIGFNNRILSPEVLFTFPSVYVFLPDKESRIIDKDGQFESVNFYSVEEWKTHRFGPFFSVNDPDRIREMEKFLETALNHAQQFRRLLVPKAIQYPKISIVSGNTVPTRAFAIRNESAKRGLDFNSYPNDMGDGETRLVDSIPGKGIPYDLYYSQRSHIHLMNDPVILKILSASAHHLPQ